VEKHSIYIHLPFCQGRCPYCDFSSTDTREIPFEDYAAAIRREIGLRSPLATGSRLDSIYVGGGTPSLWPAEEIVGLVRAALDPGVVEITVEANPGDADASWFGRLADGGVTRFSIGLQALDPARLSFLGRRHSAAQAEAAVAAARASGAKSVSADVIYGTPGQEPSALSAELGRVVALGVDHVSAYELTVAAGTVLDGRVRRGEAVLPGPDAMADLWQAAGEALAAAGFERYEVSSHARPGHRCRHNEHTWRGGGYLGLGAGAHGFVPLPDGGGRRWANDTDPFCYIEACRHPGGVAPDRAVGERVLEETLGQLDHARELLMLGLRTADGIDLGRLLARLPAEIVVRWRGIADSLAARGHVTRDGDVLRPNPAGMLQADGLAALFF
jgi:oxygen-independent coproporphyrinogen-3 oxidase